MEAVDAISRDNSSVTRNRSSWAAAEATLEFGPLPRAAAPAAIGRRRGADRVGDARPRSPPGLAGGRRIASHQRRAHEPCVAGHRSRGGEPEGSDFRVAQGSWRRPRFYSDRVRPRLSIHCPSSFDRCRECLSAPATAKAPAKSKVGFRMELSPTAPRLVYPGAPRHSL